MPGHLATRKARLAWFRENGPRMSRRGFRILIRLVVVAVLANFLALAAAATGPQVARQLLRVTVEGQGVVASADGRIDCGSQCTASYGPSSVVALTATPVQGWSFSRWTRGCVGLAPSCLVTLDETTATHAVFTRSPGEVAVTVGGLGKVVSQPRGISCGGTATAERCHATFGQGETVRLIPEPGPHAVFKEWGEGVPGCANRRV
jgi:Divergent InlB B-repeat domain